MKRVAALSIILVLIMSAAVLAEDFERTVDITVNVEPWAKFSIEDSHELNIIDGSGTGIVEIKGAVETNFPWLARITTTRVAEDPAINNWFWYECYIGGTKMFGGNPGAGVTFKRKQGLNDIAISLAVRPRDKNTFWYDLAAGQYKTSLTITVEAQTN
ncbi:MAG: hypothetical protein GX331_05645 [Firmicutes bacterium]|nr:hypothetical protein [Bacillota bacterium]